MYFRQCGFFKLALWKWIFIEFLVLENLHFDIKRHYVDHIFREKNFRFQFEGFLKPNRMMGFLNNSNRFLYVPWRIEIAVIETTLLKSIQIKKNVLNDPRVRNPIEQFEFLVDLYLDLGFIDPSKEISEFVAGIMNYCVTPRLNAFPSGPFLGPRFLVTQS